MFIWPRDRFFDSFFFKTIFLEERLAQPLPPQLGSPRC